MTQPDKSEQRYGPFLGRRNHLEGRPAVADHDFAGERKPAGIDFAGAGCVGGAQILRCNDQAVGLARAELPAQQRMHLETAKEAA